MTIEFRIPGMVMRIRAREFFDGAGIRKIRKLFQMLRESESSSVTLEEIEVWLRDRVEEESREQERYAAKLSEERGQSRVHSTEASMHRAARMADKYRTVLAEAHKMRKHTN